MKVSIKIVETIELRNKGTAISVHNNEDAFQGKLNISKANVEWCRGKTREGNGIKLKWDAFIEYMEGYKEKPSKTQTDLS